MNDLGKEIKILHKSIDSTPESARRFFKTDHGDYTEFDKFLGITMPVLRKIAKIYKNGIFGTFIHCTRNVYR